jgi:hypothetical protein
MKQFSAFGTVTSVRLEKSIGEGGSGAGGDDATILVALIKYENRIDAERVRVACLFGTPSIHIK